MKRLTLYLSLYQESMPHLRRPSISAEDDDADAITLELLDYFLGASTPESPDRVLMADIAQLDLGAYFEALDEG